MNGVFFVLFFFAGSAQGNIDIFIKHPVVSRVVGGLLELVGICNKISALWNDISLACQPHP